MEQRRLGRTGHHSSVAILGGAAFWDATPEQAGEGLALALRHGVNHLDIAPRYGAAESVVGPHLPAVRDRLFVACKSMRKNPDGLRAQLDESRRLLGCDTFDLYQAHAVTTLAELDERSPAIELILELRDQGTTRFAGITGHGLGAPAAFLEALHRWDLDTVMFPVYPRLFADPAYRADAEALLDECRARDVGVMAIKAAARRPWSDADPDRPTSPWYEPVADRAGLARGIGFALATRGVHAFCTPGDLTLLPTVLAVADEVVASLPDDEAREAAVAAMAGEPSIF